MSDLFKPVDVKRTGKNVRHFFETDFDHLMKYASPLSTVSNNRPDRVRENEEFDSHDQKYLEFVKSRILADSCRRAINSLTENSKKIISLVYEHSVTNAMVMQRLGISSSTYGVWKTKALVEFADALLAETSGNSNIKTIDLHKYLRED
ncbi:ArpU family phage packaging/lysis transcriptional regulator [Limosilactobacillus oris]|uniref:ArpU family phage packaging/lysis transcriptional regulator n=1 Tax=Limosilactobacillus oris TaxID=1632 RepID=UPI0022E80345|nr:ArpU family phage packaging/lysis transcriptional regulator [Limosilactobacillus oris]